jgi:hypothetical protein
LLLIAMAAAYGCSLRKRLCATQTNQPRLVVADQPTQSFSCNRASQHQMQPGRRSGKKMRAGTTAGKQANKMYSRTQPWCANSSLATSCN